jgi:hypothetical protein
MKANLAFLHRMKNISILCKNLLCISFRKMSLFAVFLIFQLFFPPKDNPFSMKNFAFFADVWINYVLYRNRRKRFSFHTCQRERTLASSVFWGELRKATYRQTSKKA